MDSIKVEVLGVVKDLQVSLVDYPYRIITMDTAIIDVPNVWGILLSRNFATDLGGYIQMDLSYVTIPTATGGMVRLYNEEESRYHVEVPKKLENGEQVVPQEHPPHLESEICHFFHLPSSAKLEKNKILD